MLVLAKYFLQLSDKNIFDDLPENFLVFSLSLGPVGFIITLAQKLSHFSVNDDLNCVRYKELKENIDATSRAATPPPRPAHRVLVSCGELIPKSCAQGESHLNIYNSSDNNLKHKHI